MPNKEVEVHRDPAHAPRRRRERKTISSEPWTIDREAMKSSRVPGPVKYANEVGLERTPTTMIDCEGGVDRGHGFSRV
jgi:hypothetical protein